MPESKADQQQNANRTHDYQVVARRFRPKTFAEIVGQEPILASLKRSLESGKIPHAFLFAGSRGVGKTTLARILARALNCERGPTAEPCGTCAACTSILEGSNPDVVEIDAASHNLVEDIRELRDRVGFASLGSRFKVYILDEAHMLTRSAFNAFLKTLEEPPPNVKFVLATTEIHKLPETIRSRCQIHLFARVEESGIVTRLRSICAHEQAAIADEVLEEVARTARGGMRDAETVLERILLLAPAGGPPLTLARYRELTHRVGQEQALAILAALVAGDAAPALRFAEQIVSAGLDEREALGEIVELLRALLLLHVDGAATPMIAAYEPARARLQELAAAADLHRVEAMIQAALIGRERLRRLEDRRLVLELTLVRMAQAGELVQLGEIYEALRRGSSPATAGPAAGAAASPAHRRAPAAPAPAAPPSAAPPSAAPAAGSDLKTSLVARLRAAQSLLAGTLDLCELTGPDAGGVVRIQLGSPLKLHRDRLASDAIQQDLRAHLRALLGRNVELRLETGSAAKTETPPVPAKRAEPGPAVRKVLDRFDGDLLEPEDA